MRGGRIPFRPVRPTPLRPRARRLASNCRRDPTVPATHTYHTDAHLAHTSPDARAQADTERDFAGSAFGLKTFPTIVALPKSGKPGSFVAFPSERRDADTLAMWVNSVAGYE